MVLGDRVLGKRINDDTTLVRAIWQHSSWSLGDCVVKISFADMHHKSQSKCVSPRIDMAELDGEKGT